MSLQPTETSFQRFYLYFSAVDYLNDGMFKLVAAAGSKGNRMPVVKTEMIMSYVSQPTKIRFQRLYVDFYGQCL